MRFWKCDSCERAALGSPWKTTSKGAGRRPEAVPGAEPRVAPPSQLAPRPRRPAPGAQAAAEAEARGSGADSEVTGGCVCGRWWGAERGEAWPPGPGSPLRSQAPGPSRPAPSPADATRPGPGRRPLPRGGSPEFTVRHSVAIAVGVRARPFLRRPWLPNPPGTDAPRGRSRKVCAARPTQPQPSPRPCAVAAGAWRALLTSSARALCVQQPGPSPRSGPASRDPGGLRGLPGCHGKHAAATAFTTLRKARKAGGEAKCTRSTTCNKQTVSFVVPSVRSRNRIRGPRCGCGKY